MAITKKKILPGALVMVSFPIEKEQTKNPARKFEGQEFTVKTKHIANGPMAKPQYTLYGCEGPNHKPYWFLEDELVVLSEVSEMNRYIDAEALKEKYTMVIKRYSGGIMERPAVLLETIDEAPSIDLADYVPKDFHDKTCEAMAKAHQEEITDMVRIADRPQGEWIDAEIPLESGDTMPIQVCNLCKTFYPLVYTGGGHRFCPNCGARMKGADDEIS